MPYKYIGRPSTFTGKTLWEIIGNLKGFGIGRIIARTSYEKYPEPSYLKIVRVVTVPTPEIVTLNDPRKVRVWVERTFRGRTCPELAEVFGISNIADFTLIPKDKEVEHCTSQVTPAKMQIMPRTTNFPPLLKELILRDMKAKGEEIVEEPRLTIVYRQGRENNYRVAEEGETPTVEVVCGLGTSPYPSLYKGIKV